MGKQQKHIKGLALVALMMLGALSIMATGCGGGDGGDSTTITQQALIGTWDITGSHKDNYSVIGTISFGAEEALTYDLFQVNHNPPPAQRPIILVGAGTWRLNGSSLTMNFDNGVVYEGIPQGNSSNFSLACSNGWTLNFSRR